MSADIFTRLTLEPLKEGPSRGDVADLLREAGLHREAQEAVYVVAIDTHKVRRWACVARGAYHAVIVPMPALLAVPLLAGCDRFVMAHNHPSGETAPTPEDYAITRSVVAAANQCGLILEDHLIFNPAGQYSSFRMSGALIVPDEIQMELRG